MLDGIRRLRETLGKTRESIVGSVTRLVTGRSAIDDETLEKLEEILLGADVGMDTTTRVIDAIRERARSEGNADAGRLLGLLKEEVGRSLRAAAPAGADRESAPPAGRPRVVLVVGINGAGKTTSIGKLAHRYAASGRRVMIAAADTFRAAANEQIAVWAERAGAELIRQPHGADPAAVAYDAVQAAAARGADVLMIDTAGRLHTKINLMEELKKIRRVVQKQDPSAPHEVLLVIDASTGQNGLQQAKQFGTSVGVTGVILTKLDGTARGGIVVAVARELGIPVKFIGTGEGIGDMEPFDAQEFVEALFAA